MEDFEQEQDGLPVFTKKPAQQATEDGLPILKKKELSQDGGKPSAQNSPSTSISSLGPGADLASGAVLKTIQPNTENVSINENVVTPIQNKPGRSKSVIDRDIDMSLNFSLKNPALTKTKDKIDLSTPNPNQQPRLSMPFDQEVAVQKRQITSDPQLLKEYGQTRMKQIGETINQFNSAAEDASKTYVGEKTLYQDNENSLALKTKAKELEDYQNQFRDSLKTQAAISVTGKALQLGQQLDPIQIGREVLDVISDPTLKDDEKVLAELKNPSDQYFLNPHGGVEVSKNIYDAKGADKTRQNIDYNLYRTGADAMKLYWQDTKEKIYNDSPVKIDNFSALVNTWNTLPKNEQNNPTNPINIQLNSLKNDPDLQNYIVANNEYSKADETSFNAIKQFPQVERLNKLQQLNDAFFALNEVRDVTTGAIKEPQKVWKLLFGATPSKEDIPELSKLSGVDEKQVKEFMDEGGFFSDIPYSVRLNGLFQGVARGAAETLDQTAMGIRRFTDPNSAVTETQNRISQDALNERGIMAQRNKLQDDAGKWNINPMSIANVMGYGLGQTSIQAAPALLTGGLAAQGSIAERALETIATVVPGAAASYESAYKTAAASTDDESVRKAYAFLNSLANGAAELLYSPADIVKGISGGPSKKLLFGTFMEDVTKKGLDKTVASGVADIGKKIWGAVKEPTNILLAENIEEQATNLATNTLDEKMLGIKRNQSELANQAFSTFVQTTFQTLPLALGVGIGGNHDMSGVRKQALFEVGKQPDLFKTLAQEWLDNGKINQSQFNQKVSQINQLQNIVAVLPSKDATGKNLSYEDLAELASQQFRINTNDKKIKDGALTGEVPLIEADTKEAVKRQTEILNKQEELQPGVESQTTSKTDIIFPVRNNDFAEKYFSKEAPQGEESEFDMWNRLKNEDPKSASEMVQNKKDEITSTKELPSTPISKEGSGSVGEDKTGLILYHGSPHSFENFDISKLGSGEGAQAFGHGLYFTNEESIAKGYANKLGSKKNFWEALRDGNTISLSKSDFDFISKELDSLGYDGSRAEMEDLGEIKVDGKSEHSPETLEALAVLFGKNAKSELEGTDLSKEEMDRLFEIKRKISDPQLYKIAIHEGKSPSEYDYLNWHDKLTDSQRKKISDIELPENATGQDAYKELSKKLGSDKQASDYLLSKGIDGITYKSHKGTGGASGEGKNYVIFDPQKIRVDEINGQKQKNETTPTEVSKQAEAEKPITEKPIENSSNAKEEQKTETINEGGQNDSANEQGISGQVREGKEPVQAKSNEGASREEVSPGGNVQTQEGEEIDADYTAREESVRNYAKESGIELDEDETDLATGLIGESDSVKDAVDFVIQDRINNSVQPLYNYINEIKSDKIRNREKQKLVNDHFDDIVNQLVTNKKIRKEC